MADARGPGDGQGGWGQPARRDPAEPLPPHLDPRGGGGRGRRRGRDAGAGAAGAPAGAPEPEWQPAGPPRGRQPAGPDPYGYQGAPGPHGPDGPRGPSGPPPPGRPPRVRRRRPLRRWLLALAAVIVLWLAFLIIVPLVAWSGVDRVDAEPEGNRPSQTPGTTYLLVGSDSRKGLTKEQTRRYGAGGVGDIGARTDTILMLHVPDGDGPNLLLSLPRDSMVDIPGHGTDKINAAYSLGGPKLLVRTVEQNTGVRIDDYVEIGFAGFVDIIDAVNGIEICPGRALKDPKANLDIKAGCQDVDGPTALGYARTRKFAQGDIVRAQHQRQVVAATAGEVVSIPTFVLPWRYWQVWFAGADSLRVGDNVSLWDMQRFARAMRGGGSKQCVVPIANLDVTWDPVKAPRLFRQIRQDDTSAIRCTARLGG